MKHSVVEMQLDNGAKGLVIHVPDASVMSFYISFRAGDYLAPKNKWETAHLMEHVILDGNEEYPRGRDFQAEFERNGAYSNASTGTHNITYEAECADFEWQRILNCMLLSITKPLFLKEEFQAEVGNVREELVSRSNSHFQQLSLALRSAYGLTAATYQKRLEMLDNVTLDDLVKHYKNTHYATNMRFVIAGKMNPTRRAQIRAIMANIDLPKGPGRKPLPTEKPKGFKKPLYIPNDTVENLYFYFDTFMGRRMNDQELHAISLVNSMLTETLHSRILGEARERGLVYGMSSNISYDVGYTNWWFGAQVQPKNARGLFDIIIKELQDLFDGKISEADLKAAKQYRLGRFQRSAQTVSGIAVGYMWRYFFEDVVDDYLLTPKHIKAVTKGQVIDSVRELFVEKNWGLGVLGRNDRRPANRLAEQLSVLW